MTAPLALYLEAERALNDNPTMTLFRQDKWAPIILATLMSVFGQGQREVEAEEFHGQVRRVFLAISEYVVEFPVDTDDGKAIRDRCKLWVTKGWLQRAAPNDVEVYRLRPAAREAMRIAKEMSNTRAAMSESQVRVILDRAKALALKATADPIARQERLQAEIDRMTEELDAAMTELERLQAGGQVEMADDEVILNEFLALRDEMERLPADLKQVEDSFAQMAQQIMREFLADERPHGAILGEYLDRVDSLVTADRYGRGYQQAKVLLADELEQASLRRDLDIILAHSFSGVMSEREREDVRRIVRVIDESVSGVNQQRRELTGKVSSHLRSHDAARERELTQAMQAAQAAIHAWAARHGHMARMVTPFGHALVASGHEPGDAPGALDAGDGTGVSGEVGASYAGELSVIDAVGIREHPAQRPVRTPLVPLGSSGGAGPVTLSAADIRALGGPFYEDLAAAVESALTSTPEAAGDVVFNSLPEHLRRPVDLLGLLNLATDSGIVSIDGPAAVFHAVRPDGSTQTFLAPKMTFTHSTDEGGSDDHGG